MSDEGTSTGLRHQVQLQTHPDNQAHQPDTLIQRLLTPRTSRLQRVLEKRNPESRDAESQTIMMQIPYILWCQSPSRELSRSGLRPINMNSE